MTNIAEVVNETSTVKAVDLYYESKFKQRRRLGLSQVGHKCKRYLWHKHRGYDETPPEGRVLRLFNLGNILEDQVVKDLTNAGCIITGQQAPVKFTYNGVTLRGSCDGIITGLIESNQKHLWEMKTMGSKGFKILLKNGYEKYNDQYRAQIHAYMLGLGLKKAFVTVYNKDTSELYQERIKLNEDWIVGKLQGVFEAISQDKPPAGSCPQGRLDWWERKFCDFREVCTW
ncbi:MAG: hypothetical protein ACTSXG_01770 [Alphaproteobacteria bacterium]